MNVTGIIAEYNPFHNGHLYHLQKAREMTNADYLIVIMSGDFVQRGAPAMLDKHLRTQMALSCGADLVLELPTCYACGSAEYFALGSVSLLANLGIVNALCFGSESEDLSLLSSIATVLHEEPPAYTDALKKHCKKGLPFPHARMLALEETVSHLASKITVLESPNNTLAIEYLKALRQLNSSIIPYALLRKGNNYHSKYLSENISSATAVRHSILAKESLSYIKEQIPTSAFALLDEHYQKTFPIWENDISLLLKYKLLMDYEKGYDSYVDLTSDLSDRIRNQLTYYTSYSDFCGLLKTRDMTHTRIRRSLMHILLDITKKDFSNYLHHGPTFYGRILGFRKDSLPLLSEIKVNTSIPLLSKLADAKNLVSSYGLSMLESDIYCSSLYDSIITDKYNHLVGNEYTKNIIRYSN